VPMPVVFAVVCGVACRDTVSPVPASSPSAQVAVSGDSIRLTYICGNTFRLRNANDDYVEVQWDIFNTPESGRLVLPKRPVGQAFSQVFVTASRRGTMRVFLNGRLEETKANGNRPACSTEGQETPWPAEGTAGTTDVSRVIVVTDPDTNLIYRTDISVTFLDSVSTAGQRALIRGLGAAVTGRGLGAFGLRIPDPGPDTTRLFSLKRSIRADPRIRFVIVNRTISRVLNGGRYPAAAARRTRGEHLGWSR
jgi:hypothetical protein